MSRSSRLLVATLLLATGFAAGVLARHWLPLGRWLRSPAVRLEPAAASVPQVAALPRNRRLVLVIAGQSNAANYGSERADGGPGVYVWHERALFQARDPLPGADQHRGSPWTRLGPRLILSGGYDAIVFVPLAQGGSQVTEWAPGGYLHDRLQRALRELQAAGLPADYVLWQQGESEGAWPQASGRDYLRAMGALIESTRPIAPEARWIIARATFSAGTAGNAQIREAQRLAGELPGAIPGPDFDELGAAYRSDGVHFNARGLDAVAARWHDTLSRLPAGTHPP